MSLHRTVILGEGLGKPAALNLSARIPELDGLRGFAILFVVLFHYAYFPDEPGSPLLVHIRSLFSLGWTGVDLFFVLSGFLIGGILLDAKASPNYFKTFYTRRFFRIIPIYYLWIASFIFLITLGGRVLQAHSNSHVLPPLGFTVYEQFFFIQNIWRPPFEGHTAWWLGVTWSLAVEEQFYLVAPLLIRFLKVAKLRVLLVLVVFTAPLLRTLLYFVEKSPAYHAYESTPCRADALALGVLAAVYWRNESFRAWLSRREGALTILVAVLFAGMLVMGHWYSNPYSGIVLTAGVSWVGLFYAAVLLLTLQRPAGFIAGLARTKWLRELGRVSYCVYLIHTAVSYALFALLNRTLPHLTNLRTLGITLLSAALTYLIARLSWIFVEGPLVRIGHRTTYADGSAGAPPSVASTPTESGEGGDFSSPEVARP